MPESDPMLQRFGRAGQAPATADVLIAIPPAGFGAAAFRSWRQVLPPPVDLVAVRLTGRERLIGSPAPDDIADSVRLVAESVVRLNPERYVLFGECAGALIAFEVLRSLRRLGFPMAAGLFVASQAAPHLARTC